jgi:hypothetical protein
MVSLIFCKGIMFFGDLALIKNLVPSIFLCSTAKISYDWYLEYSVINYLHTYKNTGSAKSSKGLYVCLYFSALNSYHYAFVIYVFYTNCCF